MTDPQQTEVFERVVRPYFDRLYRLAWRLTGTKAEAEDLFQELLVKAFGKLDELVHIEEPGSWLCRVMYNLFVDQHRRFARQRMHLVDEGHLPGQGLADLAGDLDPVEDQERLEQFRRLDGALQQLSEDRHGGIQAGGDRGPDGNPGRHDQVTPASGAGPITSNPRRGWNHFLIFNVL